MMQSNPYYTWIFKNLLLVVAILLFTIGITSCFSSTLESQGLQIPDVGILGVSILFSGAVVCTYFWARLRRKFVLVRMNKSKFIIHKKKDKQELQWMQIDKISRVKLVNPPTYKVKLKEESTSYYFVSEPRHIQMGLGASDQSKLGELIHSKKAELGL